MSEFPDPNSPLHELLKLLGEKGYSQQQIATQANLPAQYLSDLKQGRRPLTELTARRLGDTFGYNHEWLLGHSNLMERSSHSSEGAFTSEGTIWLPCFPWPISGDPRNHPHWNGTSIELAGAAAAKASSAQLPYVIELGVDDKLGRLRKGDLILSSQQVDPAAKIQIVKTGKSLVLARVDPKGGWARISGQAISPEAKAFGHCLGIVWAGM